MQTGRRAGFFSSCDWGSAVPAEIERIILEQLTEIRAEQKLFRRDLQDALVSMSALKAQMTIVAATAGLIAALGAQFVSHVFFS